jgi:hypothetical protein
MAPWSPLSLQKRTEAVFFRNHLVSEHSPELVLKAIAVHRLLPLIRPRASTARWARRLFTSRCDLSDPGFTFKA